LSPFCPHFWDDGEGSIGRTCEDAF
jgi:hypothetical protein